MTVIKKDANGTKTRWCEECKQRHAIEHEHFKNRPDASANTVTGSKSAADLADQARKSKSNTSAVTLAKLEQQKLEEQREALERRWGRRMRIVYGFASKLLDDPKVALSEAEVQDMGQVHADMCIAWGWMASGKFESIADVAMCHMAVIGSRSEWGQAILEKLMGKSPDDQPAEKIPS